MSNISFDRKKNVVWHPLLPPPYCYSFDISRYVIISITDLFPHSLTNLQFLLNLQSMVPHFDRPTGLTNQQTDGHEGYTSNEIFTKYKFEPCRKLLLLSSPLAQHHLSSRRGHQSLSPPPSPSKKTKKQHMYI